MTDILMPALSPTLEEGTLANRTSAFPLEGGRWPRGAGSDGGVLAACQPLASLRPLRGRHPHPALRATFPHQGGRATVLYIDLDIEAA